MSQFQNQQQNTEEEKVTWIYKNRYHQFYYSQTAKLVSYLKSNRKGLELLHGTLIWDTRPQLCYHEII